RIVAWHPEVRPKTIKRAAASQVAAPEDGPEDGCAFNETKLRARHKGSVACRPFRMMKTKATRRFRELLARPGIIPSLGAHDVFSALLMEQAGLEMIFLGGFGASASLLGLPDLNFLTQTEMADAVR